MWTWSRTRMQCGIEPGTGISDAHRSGTDPKPMPRAAVAGNMETTSAVAVKIALIVRGKFHGSFGPESAPFAEDSDLDGEERTELSVLDGRMIAHRIVGRGRARTHYWLFKPGGVPQGDTVREIVPGVEA